MTVTFIILVPFSLVMLLTFSSFNALRSYVELRSLFHDREGDGFPLAMQVKATGSPAAPGIWVVVGLEVTIVGRAACSKDHV